MNDPLAYAKMFPIPHFVLILHPLTVPENQRFFGTFRGYKIGSMARNWSKKIGYMTLQFFVTLIFIWYATFLKFTHAE